MLPLQHCDSRRHRKFAENPDNFIILDRLLHLLRRPEPGAKYVDYNTFPPPKCPYEILDVGGYGINSVALGMVEEEWDLFKDYCSRRTQTDQGE
jgi:hypothetical protein